MSFDTYESRILMHFVPRPRFGILGADEVEISYFIDNQFFTLIIMSPNYNYSYYS